MARSEKYLQKIGELLTFHRIISRPDELNNNNFEEIIMEFQKKVDIYVDGNPKWQTLWYLQYPYVISEPKLLFVKCEADKLAHSDGFDCFVFREDAAKRYKALREEILEKGAKITSAGAKRSLSVKADTGKSSKSMHYAGLAFDLATDTGFFKPDTDAFVITKGKNGYWDVWARASKGKEIELEAVYWKSWGSGKDLHKTVKDKFINFTEICKKNGFYPIKPRNCFTRSKERNYICCEWWHFQANDLLIPELSQFGIELLTIEDYTPDFIQLKNKEVWDGKRAIYQIDWF